MDVDPYYSFGSQERLRIICMKNIFKEQDLQLWKDSYFILDLLKALSLAAFALIVNYYAVRYATAHAGPSVPDFLLDHVSAINTHYIDYRFASYAEYAILFFAIIRTRSLVFFLKTMSILILVRAFFVNLTNLGIPAGTTPTTSFFTQGGDLFFSGHTALPFMATLIFWDIVPARYVLLALTLFMGTEVLWGHQHYSIDVFAAPFITYGVFVFCKRIFKGDYAKMTA